MSTNDITGARLVSKANTSEYENNYDAIFRKDKPLWTDEDEKRVDVIGQNGNTAEHYGWTKHNGTHTCPTDPEVMVEIETWTSRGSKFEVAHKVNWLCVKWFRLVDEKK